MRNKTVIFSTKNSWILMCPWRKYDSFVSYIFRVKYINDYLELFYSSMSLVSPGFWRQHMSWIVRLLSSINKTIIQAILSSVAVTIRCLNFGNSLVDFHTWVNSCPPLNSTVNKNHCFHKRPSTVVINIIFPLDAY